MVLDVNMPGLTGDKLAPIIAGQEGASPPMVVLLSSSPEEELAALAQACGAAGYIQKTGNPAEFVTRLEEITARGKLARAARG